MAVRQAAFSGMVLCAGLFFAAPAEAGNPVIGGSVSQSHSYNPFSDHHHIQTDRTRVRLSALDYDRNYMDPGSYRYVDRYFRDQYGRLVREHGPTWTTNGKPHGRLTRDTVTHYPGSHFPGVHHPGVSHGSSDTVIYNHGPQSHGSGFHPPSVSHGSSDTVIYNHVPQSHGSGHHPPSVSQGSSDTVIYSLGRNQNNRSRGNRNRASRSGGFLAR